MNNKRALSQCFVFSDGKFFARVAEFTVLASALLVLFDVIANKIRFGIFSLSC